MVPTGVVTDATALRRRAKCRPRRGERAQPSAHERDENSMTSVGPAAAESLYPGAEYLSDAIATAACRT